MKINFRDPEIKLVGSYDGRARAWRFSRPHVPNDDQAMNELKNLNLPVNGFANYHFEIKGSVLIRDFCYMIRGSRDWARSSRAELITEDNMTYSSEFKDIYTEDNNEFIELHKKSVDQNIPQDIRKKYFPYGFTSDFAIDMDARLLSNFLNTIKDSVFNNYYELFMKELDRNKIELVPHDKFKLWDLLAVNHIPENNKKVDVYEDIRTNLVTISAEITGALGSQFIRQESGTRQSTLINILKICDDYSQVPLSQQELFRFQVIVPKSVAIKIASTRSCWFARNDKSGQDSWSDIVAEIIKVLGLKPEEILPCGMNKNECPYYTNQLNTLKAGNPKYNGDVNTPCVILTGIPEIYKLRGKKYHSDSEVYKIWKDWLPDGNDITNEGKEYLNNVAKYGYAEKLDNDLLKEETKEMLNKYKELINHE